MSDRELYEQKLQAQLDAWQAELDKLEAKAKGAGAEAGLETNKQIEKLEQQMAETRAKAAELGRAGDDAWSSLKDGVDRAWSSLSDGFKEAASKFKK